jgi:hypothetical protein
VAAPVRVLVESTATKSFASALDWPGWSRSGKTADASLVALAASRSRYATVLERCDVRAPAGAIEVIGEVAGDSTTAFGAPSRFLDDEARALSNGERIRYAAILSVCWALCDERIAAAGELRSGPRGGGRDAVQIREHVRGAEIPYARKLGLRVAAFEADDDESCELLRARVLRVITGAERADRDGAWPVRYAARCFAWHALDHAWEIEDRTPLG